jgi:hypothetical protein
LFDHSHLPNFFIYEANKRMDPESTELKRMLWTAGSFDFVVLKS